MLRLTWAQMRQSVPRLTAAGIAVVIGTAFVAATLLVGNLITQSTTESVGARYAQAQVVVTSTGNGLTPAQVRAVTAAPGVAAVAVRDQTQLELRTPGKVVTTFVTPAVSDPRLEPLRVVEGTMPTSGDQIALPVAVAERVGASVGGTVDAVRTAADGASSTVRLTVTATLDDPHGAYAEWGGAGILPADRFATWDGPADQRPLPRDAWLVTDDGTSVGTVLDTLAGTPALAGTSVQTVAAAVSDQVATSTGGKDVLTSVILAFAAIALVVAGLVIANTFQVLVAQRARTLALLRCVGATKGQLARSVLVEGLVLGLVASLVGVLAGAALVQGALVVLRGRVDQLPTTIHMTWPVVVVPLLVGVLVTVVACLAPARAATRVAPLAALRPDDGASLQGRGSRARLAASVLLAAFGFLILGLGVVAGGSSPLAGLGLGVMGGFISFVGVVLGAVFWMPRVVAGLARLLGRSGPTTRLAAANVGRNPRRTSATATALLIGVTLVTMMSTGAASARQTLQSTLDSQFPVDLAVTTGGYGSSDGDGSGGRAGLGGETVAAVSGVDGVRQVVTLTSTAASWTAEGTARSLELLGVDPADARSVLRAPGTVDGLDDATVLVPGWASDGLRDGQVVRLHGERPDGQENGRSVDLRVRIVDGGSGGLTAMVTPAVLAKLDPDAPVSTLWGSLDPGADAGATLAAVQDAVSTLPGAVSVEGAAAQRASIEQVIDGILHAVLGLLAASVLIALIGVANTLSLSVIERRRESATLRAIGLTRGQLRRTLAQEGMLIAGVGAVLGVVLGIVYGWAGARSALGVLGDVTLAVPWSTILVVLGVAVLAGLLASVLPARSAVRTPPVAALAVD